MHHRCVTAELVAIFITLPQGDLEVYKNTHNNIWRGLVQLQPWISFGVELLSLLPNSPFYLLLGPQGDREEAIQFNIDKNTQLEI